MKKKQATFATLATLLLLLFFVGNWVVEQKNVLSRSEIISALYQSPFRLTPHTHLAKWYYEQNDLLETKREFALIEDLLRSNVAVTDQETAAYHQLKEEIETKPEEVQKKYHFWQQLVAEHPAYRDGWVQLFYIAFNARDQRNQYAYRQKVTLIDPNYILPEEVME